MVDSSAYYNQVGLRGLAAQLLAAMDDRYTALRQLTQYAGVRPFDAKVFVVAAREGQTESEMARLFGVTRQAVHASVERLIVMKYVERRMQPGSRRDKQIVITKLGQHAVETANEHVRLIEAECAAVIGQEAMLLLRSQLQQITKVMQDNNAK